MEELKIFIFGEIGGEKGFTPEQMQSIINQNKDAEKIKLVIDSGGGEVFAGMAIRNILLSTGLPIETDIMGVCGSIATIIAFAATDKPRIYPNARFLVHDPMVGVQGNKEDLQRAATELTNITDELVQIYQSKTGKDEQSIRDLMKEDRFMTAEEAESFGFVSVKEPELKAVAKIDLSNFNNQKMEKQEVKADSLIDKLVNKLDNVLNPKNESTEAVNETAEEMKEKEEEEEFDAKNAYDALAEKVDGLVNSFESMSAAKNEAESKLEEKESVLNSITEVMAGFKNEIDTLKKVSATSDKGEAPVAKDKPVNSAEESAFGGFAQRIKEKRGY